MIMWVQAATFLVLAASHSAVAKASAQPQAQNNAEDPVTDLIDSLHPQRYAAFHNQADEDPIRIDGLLNESTWENVPFTDAFLDIQGPRHWSQPWFATRVKLRYDEESLYVGAYLEGPEIWANETHRNAVVFHDNDFEVFVDADGSTHNYKEIEVNARNTTWNLWLNKPYRSGGHENSTRVDPVHGFDMYGKGFRSAVHVDGPINDPAQKLYYWTVEMALPLRELAKYTRVEGQIPPRSGSFWRINFSRVQWQVRVVSSVDKATGDIIQQYEKIPGVPESNWVWSPQYAVNMHRPEWWGYVQFRDSKERPPRDQSTAEVPRDHLWPLRLGAFELFYAQEAYKAAHGRYGGRTDEWRRFLPIQEVTSWLAIDEINVAPAGDYYMAKIHDGLGSFPPATIQSDSLFTMLPQSSVVENYEMSVE